MAQVFVQGSISGLKGNTEVPTHQEGKGRRSWSGVGRGFCRRQGVDGELKYKMYQSQRSSQAFGMYTEHKTMINSNRLFVRSRKRKVVDSS